MTIQIVKIGKTELYYPYRAFKISDIDSWKELLGFIWPLPLIGFQILLRKKARVLILSFLGLGLSTWSLLAIFSIAMSNNKMLLAGNIAFAAAGCLFLLYLVEVAPSSWGFIRGRLSYLRNKKP